MHGTARNAANHSKCSILVRVYSLAKHMPTAAQLGIYNRKSNTNVLRLVAGCVTLLTITSSQ